MAIKSEISWKRITEDGVADSVHQGVRVRMAVEALRMRDLHAAEDELAPGDQLMNVIANANVNHAQTVDFLIAPTKKFRG